MFELQMFIPVADNDGLPFDATANAAFEAEAAGLFGGGSWLPGEVAGVWVDAGVVYRDRSRVYAVAIRSIVDGAKVGTLAAFAKANYRQLAIYVRYLGVSETL